MKRRIYLFSSGRLERESNTIAFVMKEKKSFIPIKDIAAIYAFGEVDVNKRLLEFLTANNIPLHFFNFYGYYVGSYMPRRFYNAGIIVLQQAAYYLDLNERLKLAKKFVQAAVNNMLIVMNYYNNRGVGLTEFMDIVNDLKERIDDASNIDELMGIEGNVREVYYSSFNKIINNNEFTYSGRTRRPPTTKLNTLISFGNSMIYTIILGEIYKTHLDPRIGYLHSTNSRKFSLNLDIAEIFKPLLVDRTIFTLVNKMMLESSDFISELGGIYLNENGKKKFIQMMEERLSTTILHKKLRRKITYQGIIRMELYKLEKYFLKDEDYKPFIMRW